MRCGIASCKRVQGRPVSRAAAWKTTSTIDHDPNTTIGRSWLSPATTYAPTPDPSLAPCCSALGRTMRTDRLEHRTMTTDIVCLHLHVSGRVQGVGFRAALQETAHGLQLQGWVRNRRNGQVEALVQGSTASVDAMRHWCHQGPPMARVDAVTAVPEATDTSLSGFRCLPTAP